MTEQTPMVNWNDIQTVLLDMDGTLLDLYFDNHFWLEYLPKRYAEHHGLDEGDARTHLDPIFTELQGSLEWYCLDYWTQRLQLDVADLKTEISHLIAIRPKVIEFLQWLQAQRIPAYLVTNAHRASVDLKMEITGIHDYFNAIISSHDFGAAKESQIFWKALQHEIEFDNAHTLFIDDSLSVLRSAEQFGVKYLLTIEQPDSQLPHRNIDEYPSLLCYSHIMDA